MKTFKAEDKNGVELGRTQAAGAKEAEMILLSRGVLKLGGPTFWIVEVR